MKIVRYHEKGPPEVMKVEDAPTPEPGAGEVLFKIEACGISYGQTLQRGGRHYPVPITLPHAPGGSVAGVIEKVGEGVDKGLVGKRMFGRVAAGGYAEYGVGPAQGLIEIPDGVSSADVVACLSDGVTASLILNKVGQLAPGQSVFVPAAAGGLGFVAVQLAKLYGAGRVIGAASSEAKRQVVLALGADAVVDYTQEGWSAQVKEANGGEGVDLALEMTGGPVFYETLDAVKPGGRVVNYGNASDTDSPINPRVLLRKNLTLSGFMGGPYQVFAPQYRAEVLAFLKDGRLKAQHQTYSLEDAPKAHAAIENRTSTGRQILTPHG
ncbi:quinone oxidoreductase family protein [Phenylobacterium immobile]|uniref:quinone oxidoreductase family protein n=1 Tax=Phenylobacterium immobile TaxID=21 RepID=UPI000AE42B41|nr:zinc-binding dehydrogenase [Phenylobacterium immobile]